MITTAMEENEISLKKNKGINCPINHNLKAKEKEGEDGETKTSKANKQSENDKNFATSLANLKSNSLGLTRIISDFVLPRASIKLGQCRKKNRTIGSETRYLMLGNS